MPPFQNASGGFQDLRAGMHAGVHPVTSTSIFKGLQKAGLIDRRGWGHYPKERMRPLGSPPTCAPQSDFPKPFKFVVIIA